MLISITSASSGQSLFFIIKFKKEIDSIYYKSKSVWLLPSPLIVNRQEFSIDNAQTYVRAGMFGQKLRPYIKDIPYAKNDLNIYTAIRLAGIIQMFVLSPIFIKKQIDWVNNYNQSYQPPYPDISGPGYIWYSIGFMYSGAITYHFISKPFFRKALKRRFHNTNTLLQKE